MSEGVKTIIFAIVALVVAVAAVVSRPRQEELNVREGIGKPLFKEFDDPSKAASMKIVKYDEELGQISTFEVARDKKTGAWVIPSHASYPADVKERMRDAALMLVDLPILGVPTEMPGEHSLFGVVAPDKDKIDVGEEGVGVLVTFEDKKGQDVASLVIGKKAKDREDQRFVRIPRQDAVYAVKIDPDKLSTKFEDWIEKDLLQLESWDIEDVAIKNYTVDRTLTALQLDQKFDFDAQYKDAEWKLVNLTEYKNGQPVVGALGSDEELNKDKLNDLKTEVDKLEIVDVFRKPAGLGRDLKAGEDFKNNKEGRADFSKRGFYVVPFKGAVELFSANGEVHVGMKDGVQYVLRFGETVAASKDEETEGENRYLFAMARVDMSKLPAPELEDLPEAGEAKVEDKDADASSGETSADSTTSAEADATETAEAESKDEEEAKVKSDESSDSDADADKEAKKKNKDSDDDEPKADESNDAGADKEPEDKEAKEAEIEKERERISKENERKLNEYNEKVKKAKEKAAELNTRFGDWYYVVSEEQYEKIFLGLDDLVKTKESEEVEGDGVDAFRNLQDEGLKKKED